MMASLCSQNFMLIVTKGLGVLVDQSCSIRQAFFANEGTIESLFWSVIRKLSASIDVSLLLPFEGTCLACRTNSQAEHMHSN